MNTQNVTINVNGVTISGTTDEVTKVLNALNVNPSTLTNKFYKSSTHGYIHVESMANQHLGNAILKLLSESVEDFRTLYKSRKVNLIDLYNFVTDTPNPQKDKQLFILTEELVRRIQTGQAT